MPAPLPSLDAFDSQALQGNISRIVPALGAMDPAALPPAERLRRECLMRRFADRVRDRFPVVDRGVATIKGKGAMRTYALAPETTSPVKSPR